MRIAIICLLLISIIAPSYTDQIIEVSPDKIRAVSDFGILWGAVKFRSNAPHELIDRKGSEYVNMLLNDAAPEKVFIQFLNEFDLYVRKDIGDCGCIKFDAFGNYGQKVRKKLKKLICGKSRDRVEFKKGSVLKTIQFLYKSHRFNRKNPHLNLMPLFFYWNAVEYLYAYREEMSVDWIARLSDSIEKVLKSSSETNYELTIMELGAEMDDAHSFTFGVKAWSALRLGEYLLSANVVRLPDQKVYVDDEGAFETGLYRGDQIISIDDIPIDTLMEHYRPYTSGGRKIITNGQILRMCTQSNVKDHVIDVIRNGATVSVQVSYHTMVEIEQAYQSDVTPLEVLNANTCYLDIRKVKKVNYRDVFEHASEYKTLILDMRSYPYVDFRNILNECVLGEKQRFILYKRQDPENIGCFESDSTSVTCYTSPDTRKRNKPFNTQIIGLVNHRSVSHVEFILQMLTTYDKFTSVGNNTVGANGNIIRLNIAQNFNVKFSVVKVIDPEEGVTNGIGHTPDHLVPLKDTIKEDGILKEALRMAG